MNLKKAQDGFRDFADSEERNVIPPPDLQDTTSAVSTILFIKIMGSFSYFLICKTSLTAGPLSRVEIIYLRLPMLKDINGQNNLSKIMANI